MCVYFTCPLCVGISLLAGTLTTVNPPSSTNISSHALSHLSLRRHPNRSSAAPAETHQLQLLDLPALWRPLGVLQGRNRSRDRSPRENCRVRLGRQDAQAGPLSQ